jgi:hypothetical protein
MTPKIRNIVLFREFRFLILEPEDEYLSGIWKHYYQVVTNSSRIWQQLKLCLRQYYRGPCLAEECPLVECLALVL